VVCTPTAVAFMLKESLVNANGKMCILRMRE
jgi:hypothetical protein